MLMVAAARPNVNKPSAIISFGHLTVLSEEGKRSLGRSSSFSVTCHTGKANESTRYRSNNQLTREIGMSPTARRCFALNASTSNLRCNDNFVL